MISRRRRIVFSIVLSLVLLGPLLGSIVFLAGISRRGTMAPRAGIYFPLERKISVPVFGQADSRWADHPLGSTSASLSEEGCAVASAAMILASYGIATDPGQLNDFLTANAGFTEEGWLIWEKAAEIAADRAHFVYEDLPSPWLIDRELLRGNPVIVRLRLPSGITHFVVVRGKRGFEYLICDPSGDGTERLLSDYHTNVEALRFYRKY